MQWLAACFSCFGYTCKDSCCSVEMQKDLNSQIKDDVFTCKVRYGSGNQATGHVDEKQQKVRQGLYRETGKVMEF